MYKEVTGRKQYGALGPKDKNLGLMLTQQICTEHQLPDGQADAKMAFHDPSFKYSGPCAVSSF